MQRTIMTLHNSTGGTNQCLIRAVFRLKCSASMIKPLGASFRSNNNTTTTPTRKHMNDRSLPQDLFQFPLSAVKSLRFQQCVLCQYLALCCNTGSIWANLSYICVLCGGSLCTLTMIGIGSHSLPLPALYLSLILFTNIHEHQLVAQFMHQFTPLSGLHFHKVHASYRLLHIPCG